MTVIPNATLAMESTLLPMRVPNTKALEASNGPSENDDEARKTFHSVMGEMLFGQMLKSMRKTVGKPAYFHGGQAEEIFTGQLDQVLAKKLADANGASYVDSMYELWTLRPN